MASVNGKNERSSNPNNPDCSSIVQALVDLKDNTRAPVDAVMQLLDYLKDNKDDLREADKAFHSHEYPQHSIVFSKISNEYETFRFLSMPAIAVLMFLSQNMNCQNAIRASSNQIVKYSTIGNKDTVKKAISELKEKGCIAIVFEGTGNEGAVYMVNPLLATVGREKPYLIHEFWKLTGSKIGYEKGEHGKSHRTYSKLSKPHKTWNELTFSRVYSIGKESQKIKKGDKHCIQDFNCFNKPEIEIKKPSDTGDASDARGSSAADISDEELPL